MRYLSWIKVVMPKPTIAKYIIKKTIELFIKTLCRL